jgi:hypothetical protein
MISLLVPSPRRASSVGPWLCCTCATQGSCRRISRVAPCTPSGQAAEPPEAVPGQGQGEVDRGLGRLEAPVAAGGLVGDGLPDAVAAQAVNEGGGAQLLAGGRRRR